MGVKPLHQSPINTASFLQLLGQQSRQCPTQPQCGHLAYRTWDKLQCWPDERSATICYAVKHQPAHLLPHATTHPPHPTPGPASSDAAKAAIQLGGRSGAAQTYTVSGSPTFKFDSDASSGNMLDFPATGSPPDAAYNQALPSGPSGTYGNENSPDDIPIDDWVEFGTDFSSGAISTIVPTVVPTIAAAPFGSTIVQASRLQVLVDVAQTGRVTITTQRLSGAFPRDGLMGTLTLTSSLYAGATSVEPVVLPTPVQLEDVLADSFVLEGGDQDAQAAALPSDKAASEPPPVLARAVRPAQASPPTVDSTSGTLTFPLSATDFISQVPSAQTYQVVSGTGGTAQYACNHSTICPNTLTARAASSVGSALLITCGFHPHC